MDRSFWRSIKENAYTVPAGYSVEALTPFLLSYLGSSDFELRDGFAYRILIEWFDKGYYAHADLWDIATQMLHNLTIGLGEQHNDTVFLRSYSVLMLAEIVYYDVMLKPEFSEDEIHHILEQVLAYFHAEQDLRGYVPGKEWIHTVAHSADCFFSLAKQRFVSTPDMERIMNALAEKITAPVAHVYLYDEDERLTRPIMAALQRDMLSLPFLTTWLEQFTHSRGRDAWDETRNVETCARHNSKHFLRSLYFQLRAPGFGNLPHIQQRPALADGFLPLVERTLYQIGAWC